jgi:hypothetical protein
VLGLQQWQRLQPQPENSTPGQRLKSSLIAQSQHEELHEKNPTHTYKKRKQEEEEEKEREETEEKRKKSDKTSGDADER